MQEIRWQETNSIPNINGMEWDIDVRFGAA
jgi:hypothetical protein